MKLETGAAFVYTFLLRNVIPQKGEKIFQLCQLHTDVQPYFNGAVVL
jgi:hypothetical protein